MQFAVSEYIAIGFPLLVGLLLFLLFPIKPGDYFFEEEQSGSDLERKPYRLTLKNSVYIYLIYIVSTAVLGLAQAFLLWRFAHNPYVLFDSRFTDYIFYPFIVSGLMGLFVTWFVFSCHAFTRGKDAVRNSLRISFDGWDMKKRVGQFKYLVLAGALATTAANFWAYNIFLAVTDTGIVTSHHKMLKHFNFIYDRIDFFRIEWNKRNNGKDDNEFFVLGFELKDGGYVRTDWFMFYNENNLMDIERVIESANFANGKPIQTVFTEFVRNEASQRSTLVNKK